MPCLRVSRPDCRLARIRATAAKERIVPPLKIGFGVPRGLGDPSKLGRPEHKVGLRYAQRAEELGFDSVWVPDHYFFERPPGTLTPYPEAWTLMTAIGATTSRVQIGSMVMAAWARATRWRSTTPSAST